MFEQSLLLNQDTKRPWNFVASLSAELLVVSLALLIPLLYRDHLPAVHWKDIVVGPPPPAREAVVPPAKGAVSAVSTTLSSAPPRKFHWDPNAGIPSAPAATGDFTAEAPPAIGAGDQAGNTNMLGRIIPNIVAAPPPKPPAETHIAPAEPIRVSEGVQMAMLLRKVMPEYPPLARTARISGIVRLIGTIAKDGTIQNLQLVSGHPILAKAAMDAVRQWVYKPTLLNGNPVEVIAPVQVSFTLGK